MGGAVEALKVEITRPQSQGPSVEELNCNPDRLTPTLTSFAAKQSSGSSTRLWFFCSLVELMVSPPHWSPHSGVIFHEVPPISLTSTICLTCGLRLSHVSDSVDRRGNKAIRTPAWVKLISGALKFGTRQSNYLSHSGGERGRCQAGEPLAAMSPVVWKNLEESKLTFGKNRKWKMVLAGCWRFCFWLFVCF